MRADRLISILLLLQNNERMTTRELAKELEVTERTIHRDMEALSAAGIPVLAERGKFGGWRLLEKYRTNLTGLKADEIKTLLLSPSFQHLADLGISDDWKEARQKLLAAIPAPMKDDVKDISNRIHIDTGTWRQTPREMKSFGIVQQAVWEEKKLQIQYEKAGKQTSERIVEPLGLVAKGNIWYLIAASDEKIKSYRVSRIVDAKLLKENFSRPNDFDLAGYWQESKQKFISSLPRFEVEVEMAPTIIQRINFTGRFVQVIHLDSPKHDGWIPASLCFDTEQEAREYILGFGNQIKIVRPVSLRKSVRGMAEGVVNLYSENER
ncbi:putative DNA-binding transcriptional regulator YafY [Cytobacillus firmus]|uniref:Putative DNA-binding transcriptional regulator YafY n=2 Tax=Cytobacillus TaxID=2675230 RepID=A0A366K258_CYTFI|nr:MULTISPECIES: YafY family protein [Cytobacillus]RBP95402.1 putative DNA-binding transcriptional regulator YafY [Cytobacillus firmus]TDX44243.1 putative DNA-binding transcriptional regulator YafY [Cytobacillus oceanisediminis]